MATSVTTSLRIQNKDDSRSRIVYLYTRSQELSACNPVLHLLHTPGPRVRGDAGASGYAEQEVAREEADEFVHFWDWCPGAKVGGGGCTS